MKCTSVNMTNAVGNVTSGLMGKMYVHMNNDC